MIGSATRLKAGSPAVRNRQVGKMAAKPARVATRAGEVQAAQTTPIGAIHRHPFAHIVGVMILAVGLVFGAGMVGVAASAAAVPAAIFAAVILAGIVIAAICGAGMCLERAWR